jgi:hypothetical protein
MDTIKLQTVSVERMAVQSLVVRCSKGESGTTLKSHKHMMPGARLVIEDQPLFISDYSRIRSSCIRLWSFGEFNCSLMTHGKALSKLGERIELSHSQGNRANDCMGDDR